MPNCSQFLFGKWPANQPYDGLDINAYRQYVKPMTSQDKCTGIIKAGFCYDYVVLKEVCIIVEIDDAIRLNAVKGANYWQFNRGCFEGGAITRYEKAVAGNSYDFSDIKYEI
jgi:hypothetical protein